MSDVFRLGAVGVSSDVLSGHNRSVSTRSRIMANETELSDGTLVRDPIAVLREWDIDFKQLPHKSANTVDQGMGVEDLRALLEVVSESSLSLVVPNEDGSDSVYSVMVAADSYQERLVSRRNAANWKSDVSFTLIGIRHADGTGDIL